MSKRTPSTDPDAPREQNTVSVVRITDPTMIGESTKVLDQDVVSLETGAFEAKRVTVPFEDCCLIYQSSNSRLRSRTRIHDAFDARTILGPKSHGSLDGVELTPGSMIAAGPGMSGEIIIDSGYESVMLLVPPIILEHHLALRGRQLDVSVPDGAVVWHPDPGIANKHFELGRQISDAAEDSPDSFNNSRSARYGAQVEYMDSLLATIESCREDNDVDNDRKGKNYSQIVQACEDYTLSLDGQRPYLSELCAAAHVSERTLQYAFRDIMGMSPLTYLHRLRLHRARDELHKADDGSTTVTDVATNWGFWHFGEFSRSYKNCFGEVPSRTLKQTPLDPDAS